MIRESEEKLTRVESQAEALEMEGEELRRKEKELEFDKFTLETKLTKSNNDMIVAHDKIRRLESELQNTVLNAGGYPDLASELRATRADLERREKGEKKLKKSLGDAVQMLNTLRNHVLVEERERKKWKRRLKSQFSSSRASGDTSTTSSEPEVMSDSDRREDQVTIMQLKSHIVAMEHEITCLQDRVLDMEASHQKANTHGISNDQEERIGDLEERLRDAERAHEDARSMLAEVSEINKELLNDLKQTEAEGAEIMEDLEIVKGKLRISQEEIDNAKYVAAAAIRKFDELVDKEREKGSTVSGGSGVKSFGSVRSGGERTLTGYINKLSEHVNIVIERNNAVEDSFGMNI